MEVEKGPDGSLPRPGDVLVHGLVDESLPVDVGTLQQSILLAVVQPGQRATKMEQRNTLERQALCRRCGWSFLPFAMVIGLGALIMPNHVQSY